MPASTTVRIPAPRRRAQLALTALGFTCAACAGPAAPAVSVACSEIRPAGAPAVQPAPPNPAASPGLAPPLAVKAEDVLELVVVLDSVPAGPGSVLVRVDGLEEPGIVRFTMPPPTAAAAGMTLAPPPVFQGCAGIAPVGLELRAPRAPRSKAWIRASTDRVVRVRLRVGNRSTEEPLLIEPGTSGIVRWQDA